MKFIRRNEDFATFEQMVSAPYFRRHFSIHGEVVTSKLHITGLGFYEVHINGINITKGFLAPYRSNPDHFIYYDEYEVNEWLREGKNVIACIVGNGWQNSIGGYIWKFDEAAWRGAVQLAFRLEITYADGTSECIESDSQTRTADSPIVFNDLHYGEYYDARLEIQGWDLPEYDDTKWDFAKVAIPPRGELRLCTAEPIVSAGELVPLDVTPYEKGYIYDFGENNAGICRLTINGKRGQKILLQCFETLVDGKPHFDNIRFYSGQRYQEDEYICSGSGIETHEPRFTYHGFRYVYVTGITEQQATKELLVFVLLHSNIRQNGEFTCDDEVVNKIQEATLRSDISNFHYFPTDCPQREKNGWTGDISLSAEQMLLNYTPENSFREWLRNVYKAQDGQGQLPGIVPTGGWGYLEPNGHAWNGPAWDGALINLPYYIYCYRGERQVLLEASASIMHYLTYLYSMLNQKDLLEFGLGDWCQPNRKGESDYATPLVVTDSIVAADIATKAAAIFDALEMKESQQYAEALYQRLRKAVRKHLIDLKTCSVMGHTQTGQAIAIAYGMFEESEKIQAVSQLLKRIEEKEGFMDTGIIGARVIFRVLAENGYADVAYDMITRPEYPSYGNWMVRGATTLWEGFWRDSTCRMISMNHHFWGDVSAWFYIYLAGIRVNPKGNDINQISVSPCFVKKLNEVKAYHVLPAGKVSVEWQRADNRLYLKVIVPQKVSVSFELPCDFVCTQEQIYDGEVHIEWQQL